MNLLELKRFLDKTSSSGHNLTTAEIAATIGVPSEEVVTMMNILAWQGHLVKAESSSCNGQCKTCPLRSICSAGAFNLNISYKKITSNPAR